MTCMTPRAFALETIALLNPLSCQAIAEASEPGTPLRPATVAMSAELTRPGVGAGGAGVTTLRGAAGGGTGAPVWSFWGPPAMRIPLGAQPLAQAPLRTQTP